MNKAELLLKKFNHGTWYKGSNLNWKNFLELAAESRSFYIGTVLGKEQSDKLLDDLNYDVVLKNESGNSYIKLTEEQLEYYKQRESFWKDWHKNYEENNFKGKYDGVYMQAEKEAKLNVPEYAEAISKVKGGIK